jgi:hypothetical protein
MVHSSGVRAILTDCKMSARANRYSRSKDISRRVMPVTIAASSPTVAKHIATGPVNRLSKQMGS